jgi:hypothetical protein
VTLTIREPTSRRFTLLDGMILIAATAVGFALIEWYVELLGISGYFRLISYSLAEISLVVLATAPLLSMLSFGLLVLRLRPPRPSLHRLLCQPGFVASISVTISSVVSVILILAMMLSSNIMSSFIVIISSSLAVGCGVSTPWSVLFLSGRWRGERSWIDRAGRVLGACWLGQILALMSLLIAE